MTGRLTNIDNSHFFPGSSNQGMITGCTGGAAGPNGTCGGIIQAHGIVGNQKGGGNAPNAIGNFPTAEGQEEAAQRGIQSFLAVNRGGQSVQHGGGAGYGFTGKDLVLKQNAPVGVSTYQHCGTDQPSFKMGAGSGRSIQHGGGSGYGFTGKDLVLKQNAPIGVSTYQHCGTDQPSFKMGGGKVQKGGARNPLAPTASDYFNQSTSVGYGYKSGADNLLFAGSGYPKETATTSIQTCQKGGRKRKRKTRRRRRRKRGGAVAAAVPPPVATLNKFVFEKMMAAIDLWYRERGRPRLDEGGLTLTELGIGLALYGMNPTPLLQQQMFYSAERRVSPFVISFSDFDRAMNNPPGPLWNELRNKAEIYEKDAEPNFFRQWKAELKMMVPSERYDGDDFVRISQHQHNSTMLLSDLVREGRAQSQHFLTHPAMFATGGGRRKRKRKTRRRRRRKHSRHPRKRQASRTRKGRLDFVTHKGNVAFNRSGHRQYRRRRPYTRRKRH
jgi:hypothetical protein